MEHIRLLVESPKSSIVSYQSYIPLKPTEKLETPLLTTAKNEILIQVSIFYQQ